MNTIAESHVIPQPTLKPQIDIDQILKESKEQALSDIKYLKEVDRIKNFLSNVKNTKTSDIDFIDNANAESVPFIDQLFDCSQVLEDNMCQFSDCLWGISDDILSSVRVIDGSANVSDYSGLVYVLKQGDLLVRYDSGVGAVGYLTKSGSRSKRYSEKYISTCENINYKIIGIDNLSLNKDWLFVADNFLSAIAIHHATGVMTIAIPFLDHGLLMQLKDQYSEKRIMIFGDSKDVAGEIESQGVCFTPSLNKCDGWAALREECFSKSDHKQGLAMFKEHLRQAMRSAM